MPEMIPGAGKTRTALTIQFACDQSPEDGGPPRHKHTGATYVVTPPKTAAALRFALAAGDNPRILAGILNDWMRRAFGKTVAADLRERLYGPDDLDAADSGDYDEDDPLDIEDITSLMQVVSEKAAGVPPT